jgi:hypothetical protein
MVSVIYFLSTFVVVYPEYIRKNKKTYIIPPLIDDLRQDIGDSIQDGRLDQRQVDGR